MAIHVCAWTRIDTQFPNMEVFHVDLYFDDTRAYTLLRRLIYVGILHKN